MLLKDEQRKTLVKLDRDLQPRDALNGIVKLCRDRTGLQMEYNENVEKDFLQ